MINDYGKVKPVNVVAYVRCQYDNDRYSPDRQFNKLKELAAKWSLQIIARFDEDPGVNGMSPDYPGFAKAVAFAAEKRVDLLIADPSRIGRNWLYITQRLHMLRDAGVVCRLATGQVMDAPALKPLFERTPEQIQQKVVAREALIREKSSKAGLGSGKQRRAKSAARAQTTD